MATVIELPVELFKGPVDPDWCPGCGDFGVLNGVKQAAAKLGIKPENLLVVSGIGCSSNLPGFIHAYGIHSLHGRAVPVATGAHLANTDLNVIITGGDGDGYGIGVGHLLHAMRRNLNVTYLVMDNQIYGLTTGQTSPTTSLGIKTKSTPQGNIENPINPLALALTAGATFVARAFSGETKHLAETIAAAIEHKGFSLVDIFSPCVTYNKVNTYPFFKERVYKLEDENWDPSDFHKSMQKSFEWGDKIPLGVLYKTDMPTYEDGEAAFKKGALVKQSLKADKDVFQSVIDEMI